MPSFKRIVGSSAFQGAVGTAAAWYLRLVWHTSAKTLEPATIYDTVEMPAIIAMWHGQHFLTPFIKHDETKHRAKVLISRHRDGEINALAAEKLGIGTIRGSGAHNGEFNRKGGAAAFSEMLEALEQGYNVALTADVPKVARVAGLGVVKLAQHSGRPIYPVAIATSRRIELDNWDRTAINLPFGRVALVATGPILVARDADDAGLEAARQAVEHGTQPGDGARLCDRRPHRGAGIVSDALPATLRTYRLLSAAAAPLVPLWLARRLKRGKEDGARLSERRGAPGMARPPGPLVWLHGASVGELASVLPLIERIGARGIGMLVTTGTVTSGGLAEQRLPRGVIHQFVPLDVPRFVRRFLEHWRPDLALFVESDLWPNMMIETSRRGVPMILVNGRLSENSFRRWRYLPGAIGNLLRRFDLCLAGTPGDATRLGDLGAPRVVTTGNLKLDVPAPPADSASLKALADAIGRRPVIAAVSTHAGEESIVIAAHGRLRAQFPGLLTLIAPRHPERGPGVAEIARAAGLSATLRSRGALPVQRPTSMSPTPWANSA